MQCSDFKRRRSENEFEFSEREREREREKEKEKEKEIERESSKEGFFAMADGFSAIPASVLRNLSDKLYEKRKNAALEVSFSFLCPSNSFDRFWFLGFLMVLLDLVGVVYIIICTCMCCVCIGRRNCEATRGGRGSR